MPSRQQLFFWATTFLVIAHDLPSAKADQWLLSGAVSERLLIDSNIRLSNTDNQPVFGSITSLNANLAWNTPRASINVSGFAAVERYTNDSSLNSESFGVSVQSFYRLPRGSIGLGANIQRASTLQTERLDAGNFDDVANQFSIAIYPSWQYELSPIETISLSGAYTRQIFDQSTFTGSATYSANMSWRRQLGPTESVTLGTSILYIETGDSNTSVRAADQSNNRTQSYSVFAGWSKSLTPNLGLSITAGPRLSISQGNGDNVNIGADFDLQLTYALSERTTLVAAAGQTIEPSSTGQIQERQRARLALQHQFSPRLAMTVSGILQHDGQTFTSGSNSDDDRRLYYSASASLSYRFSPTLSGSVQYDFSAQNRYGQRNDNGSGFAHSHVAAIVLTYSPRAWILGH